jgi:Ca2+-binding EF-hand superfamily protein
MYHTAHASPQHLLRVVDPDQSGEISFEEFQSNILGLDKQ